MREQDKKGIETRKMLGPRLARSRPIEGRVYTSMPVARTTAKRARLPRDTGG
jgi:hypothetical protein